VRNSRLGRAILGSPSQELICASQNAIQAIAEQEGYRDVSDDTNDTNGLPPELVAEPGDGPDGHLSCRVGHRMLHAGT
jgi:hypothetical protein